LVVIAISGRGFNAAMPATTSTKGSAQQWLAAGEAHMGHPESDEDRDDSQHLLVGEHLGPGHPRQSLGGHARRTAQVAAVREQDPQIRRDPKHGVGHARGRPDTTGRLFMTPRVGRYRRWVLRVVFSRRWLSAFAVAALFALACVLLGRWQWGRHEDRVAIADRINSHYFGAVVPLSAAMPAPAVFLPSAKEWTLVSATGRYAAAHLMLVRDRPNNGVFGYEVVVPLQLAGGESLLVDRGWIPNGRTAAEPSTVPATPAGVITVTGWLRVGEPSLGRQMTNGQLASINLAEARAQTDTSLYGAYLIRRAEAGPPGEHIETPQALEMPDTDLGPHLAYALQWWLAVPVGFVLVLLGARREHLDGSQPWAPVPGGAAPARPPRVRKTRIWDEEDE
jgi:cytochrome oxidase assembly protein ShyY1